MENPGKSLPALEAMGKDRQDKAIGCAYRDPQGLKNVHLAHGAGAMV